MRTKVYSCKLVRAKFTCVNFAGRFTAVNLPGGMHLCKLLHAHSSAWERSVHPTVCGHLCPRANEYPGSDAHGAAVRGLIIGRGWCIHPCSVPAQSSGVHSRSDQPCVTVRFFVTGEQYHMSRLLCSSCALTSIRHRQSRPPRCPPAGGTM